MPLDQLAASLENDPVRVHTAASIIPPNNLRLPDAITIKHGPTRLLSRFVLEGDMAARRAGLRLRLRHDFDELVYLNRQHVSQGNWFRLVDSYNPNYTELGPENAFWIAGEDEHGEIAATWAARVFSWPEATLAERAGDMFYGRATDQSCIVTAPAAKLITGVVLCGGAAWVRPDFRGRQLSQLVPRIGKAYAFGRWPTDWSICYVSRILVEKGVAAGYGQKNFSYSIFYPKSPWGDLEVVLAYTTADDSYADLANFMETDLSSSGGRPAGIPAAGASAVPRILEHMVTNTSSDGVRHGSIRRS
jgi:hypothetical protein